MIAHLRGTFLTSDESSVILDVAGVGYRVFATDAARTAASSAVGELSLWTHTVIREQSHELYGFLRETDVRLFELLIGVSGVGPKSALAILNLAPASTLAAAIRAGDLGYLTKVSGIGKKNAEKIVLELKDRLAAFVAEGGDDEAALNEDAEVIEALTALGYSMQDARTALLSVSSEVAGTNARITAALKQLG